MRVTAREEFFYQLVVFNFGCFYKIQFMEREIDVAECLRSVLDAKKESASLDVVFPQLPHV